MKNWVITGTILIIVAITILLCSNINNTEANNPEITENSKNSETMIEETEKTYPEGMGFEGEELEEITPEDLPHQETEESTEATVPEITVETVPEVTAPESNTGVSIGYGENSNNELEPPMVDSSDEF